MKKIEKTRNEIVNAFWNLLKEMELEKITVKNISQKANINRSTFYNYFFDVSDLTNQAENELIEDIKKEAIKIFSQRKKGNEISLSTFFTELFQRSNDKIFILLSSKGDPSFMNKIKREVVPLACSLGILDKKMPNFEYIITYIFSAAFGLVTQWYENGKDIPVDDFSKMAQVLIATGTLGISKNNK